MRETIGEKIGTLRKSKNITQAQLAETVGISDTYMINSY